MKILKKCHNLFGQGLQKVVSFDGENLLASPELGPNVKTEVLPVLQSMISHQRLRDHLNTPLTSERV